MRKNTKPAVICLCLILLCMAGPAKCYAAQDSTSEIIPGLEVGINPVLQERAGARLQRILKTEQVVSKRMTLAFSFGKREGYYSGALSGGIPQGAGSFTAFNEDGTCWTYTGNFEDGHMSGNGITRWNTGLWESGLYEADNIKTGVCGTGSAVIYQGDFCGGAYSGEGTTYDEQGNLIYSGRFQNGFLCETEAERTRRGEAVRLRCEEFGPEQYRSCLADPALYIGRMIGLSGDVAYSWFAEEDAYNELLLELPGSGDMEAIVYYRYGLEEKKADRPDRITVYGIITGVHEYEDGNKVPLVEAHYIDIVP
ncbi:hypothetical protein [Anaerolentibacter hominis]|uniref:hypothetical protein n=1 Tax=Anaerolentibacter hominis TaxID=3079009 RepID=UPI0031B820D5